jgi:hypothetical protein
MVQRVMGRAFEISGARHGFLSDRRLHVLLILTIGIIAYSNTFHVPLQWDDLTYISENPMVKQPHYFFEPSKAKGLQFYDHFVQRYVTYLTFAFNYAIHGFKVPGYHILNLIIHLLNALMVYLLVCLTFRTPVLGASTMKDKSELVAVFTAIIFVSHPIHTMAVTYIYQRLASLVTLFYLLSLISYIQSRLSQNTMHRILFYGGSLLSAVIAMKSKENAFTLPFAIALFEFIFFNGKIKARVLHLIPIMLTLLIIPLSLIGDEGADLHRGKAMTGDVYFFTQLRVLVMYLRLLFFPVQQSVIYDISTSLSFFELKVILSFLFLMGIFCLGAFLLIRSRIGRPELRIIAFGIFWFFLTHAVESSFIPLQLAQEYRMYLPSIGILMSISTGISRLSQKSKFTWTIALAIVITVPLILTAVTYSRNTTWQTRLGLWKDTMRNAPNNPIVNFNLGVAYTENGLINLARKYYEGAITLKPGYARAYNNLGCTYGERGNPDKAIALLILALEKDPNLAIAHYNLGLAYVSKRQFNEAEVHFSTALKMNPGIERAQKILARIKQKNN